MQYETAVRRPASASRAIAVIALLMLGASMCLASQPTRRIRFKPGATSARVEGHLSGMKDEARFVLKAKAGQHMRASITTADGTTVGMLYFPSGKQDGQPGGLFFDGDLTETGDYRIGVSEHNMADAWKGHFTLVVEIT